MSPRRTQPDCTPPTLQQNSLIDGLLDADGTLAEAEAPLQAMARLRPLSPWEASALDAILSQRWELYVLRSAIERTWIAA